VTMRTSPGCNVASERIVAPGTHAATVSVIVDATDRVGVSSSMPARAS